MDELSFNQRVGIAIKTRRVKMGMKQSRLAELLNTHRSVISHIETGLPNTIGRKTIQRIGHALEMDDGWVEEALQKDIDPYNPQVRVPEAYSRGLPGQVQRRRVERLISQVELSELANVPYTVLADLELGRGRIVVPDIVSVLRALDIDILGKLRQSVLLYEEVSDLELERRHIEICMMFRAERRMMKMGISVVADEIGMNKGNLSRIERGKFRALQPKTMRKLVRSLGLETEWFDLTYRRYISPVDNSSWVCMDCLSVWSRYRIECECRQLGKREEEAK
jgi:transcriptional regulator with XRE-family HTH domain